MHFHTVLVNAAKLCMVYPFVQRKVKTGLAGPEGGWERVWAQFFGKPYEISFDFSSIHYTFGHRTFKCSQTLDGTSFRPEKGQDGFGTTEKGMKKVSTPVLRRYKTRNFLSTIQLFNSNIQLFAFRERKRGRAQ